MVKVVGKKEVTESIKLAPASAPSAEQGKIYFDSTSNKLKVSTDGTTFTEIPSPPNPSQGDILYYDGTNWVKLPAGTSGQYLKTQGEGANPTWADVDAGIQEDIMATDTNTYTTGNLIRGQNQVLKTYTFTPSTSNNILFAIKISLQAKYTQINGTEHEPAIEVLIKNNTTGAESRLGGPVTCWFYDSFSCFAHNLSTSFGNYSYSYIMSSTAPGGGSEGGYFVNPQAMLNGSSYTIKIKAWNGLNGGGTGHEITISIKDISLTVFYSEKIVVTPSSSKFS
jgi:hypothetical protein